MIADACGCRVVAGPVEATVLGNVAVQCRALGELNSLEIKNAVFTDLFSDQSNIVYVHVDGDTRSLMLNKRTPVHELTY